MLDLLELCNRPLLVYDPSEVRMGSSYCVGKPFKILVNEDYW